MFNQFPSEGTKEKYMLQSSITSVSPHLPQTHVGGSCFLSGENVLSKIELGSLSLLDLLKIENGKVCPKKKILIKIWFDRHLFKKGNLYFADFVEGFDSLKEAKEASKFVAKFSKELKACYIVRVNPPEIIERVIDFPA